MTFKFYFSRWHFNSFKPPQNKTCANYGVTILKPLKFSPNTSADLRTLKTNLQSFFELEYQTFEILFCIRDVEDAAVEIVNALIKQYPKVDAKLLIGKKIRS